MRHGRVKDAASYETVTHSPPCTGQRNPVRRGGTRRCRPTNMDGLPRVVCGADTSSNTVRHKAAAHHPLWGGDGGLRAYALGVAPVATGAWGRWGVSLAAASGNFAPCRRGSFARSGGRPGALPPGPLRFGLSASRWQEWSARNFASGQGVVSQPYWMYGKKPHRRHGGKGPASTADTRVVGSPHKKKIE